MYLVLYYIAVPERTVVFWGTGSLTTIIFQWLIFKTDQRRGSMHASAEVYPLNKEFCFLHCEMWNLPGDVGNLPGVLQDEGSGLLVGPWIFSWGTFGFFVPGIRGNRLKMRLFEVWNRGAALCYVIVLLMFFVISRKIFPDSRLHFSTFVFVLSAVWGILGPGVPGTWQKKQKNPFSCQKFSKSLSYDVITKSDWEIKNFQKKSNKMSEIKKVDVL